MNFFIASFATVRGSKFTPNKNGVLPVIGNVVAGTFHSSVVDGTMFSNGGYSEGKLYLCKNTQEEYEGKLRWRTEIVGEASITDLVSFAKTNPVQDLTKTTVEVTQPVSSVLPD